MRSADLNLERAVLAAVFVGGFAGAIARGVLLELIPSGPGEWPWATLIANLVGAFVLGYLATRLRERETYPAHRRHLLETGFCGALTTFSTMQLELVRMLEGSDLGLALTYAGVSIGAGLLAVALGSRIARTPEAAR